MVMWLCHVKTYWYQFGAASAHRIVAEHSTVMADVWCIWSEYTDVKLGTFKAVIVLIIVKILHGALLSGCVVISIYIHSLLFSASVYKVSLHQTLKMQLWLRECVLMNLFFHSCNYPPAAEAEFCLLIAVLTSAQQDELIEPWCIVSTAR